MTRISIRKPLSASIEGNKQLSPLLQRIFSARGVRSHKEIDYVLKHLQSPFSLQGLEDALTLLVDALKQQQRVVIAGDFDADGATSCTLAVLSLKAMGLESVDYIVPNRMRDGYGLTPQLVDQSLPKRPDLIITVDNGISSCEGVARAKELGIRVLITDHHLPPKQLPAADAIVNPNQEKCDFPSKALAGVGVIFYVILALRSQLRELNWFSEQGITEPNLATFLDLVALGTVADVVPLDHSNRILVHQGVQRIRSGHCRPGIRALLEVAGKETRRLSTQDLGFVLGPRLNAAGRLDDMSIGIQCLLAEDDQSARTLAKQLDHLNRERRSIEASMQLEALALIESLELDNADLPWGLCLHHEDWHQGVIGILSSRIKDKYHRPVIAFAPEDDQYLKGSARSIPGLHIRDLLADIAALHPKILKKFGGHAMAAGMSLHREHYSHFAQLFDEAVRSRLSPENLSQRIETDGVLSSAEFTLETAYEVEAAGPWGQQFPEPSFCGEFTVIHQQLLGEKHLKLVVSPLDNEDITLNAIAFNVDTEAWPNEDIARISLVYRIAENVFRGESSLQLIVQHLQLSPLNLIAS